MVTLLNNSVGHFLHGCIIFFQITIYNPYKNEFTRRLYQCNYILTMNSSLHKFCLNSTGKSFSEALILASVNPQCDERLFIELQEKYKLRTCCVQKLFFCFCFDIQNNIGTQYVLNLYFSGDSVNNLLSYCGLTDSRMRASDTDLPV